MKKYKQLIFAEYKSTMYILLVMLILCGFAFTIFVSGDVLSVFGEFSIGRYLEYYGANTFVSGVSHWMIPMTVGFSIAAVALCTAQYKDVKDSRTGEFMAALPFTKKKRFLVKYLYGISVYSAFMLVLLLGVLCVRAVVIGRFNAIALYSRYYDILLANDGVFIIIQMFVFVWLSVTVLYTFCMFMQNLINNGILAALSGAALVYLPDIILPDIEEFIVKLGGKEFLTGDFTLPWKESAGWIEIGEEEIVTVVYLNNNWLLSAIITVCLILILAGGAYYLSGKYELADTAYVISKKWVKALFIVIISVTGALKFINGGGLREMSNGAIIAIALIVAAAIGFILHKVMKMCDNH